MFIGDFEKERAVVVRFHQGLQALFGPHLEPAGSCDPSGSIPPSWKAPFHRTIKKVARTSKTLSLIPPSPQ
jgi:hypothetical protein